jgi:putative transcriptional regulator
MTATEIAAIRHRTKLSQIDFAKRYRLSPRTVAGWERGARAPDAAATTLLTMIGSDPNIAAMLLRRAAA